MVDEHLIMTAAAAKRHLLGAPWGPGYLTGLVPEALWSPLGPRIFDRVPHSEIEGPLTLRILDSRDCL